MILECKLILIEENLFHVPLIGNEVALNPRVQSSSDDHPRVKLTDSNNNTPTGS